LVLAARGPRIELLRTSHHVASDPGVKDYVAWLAQYQRLGWGGGINPGYEAELQFDGTTYPSNPTVLRSAAGRESGRRRRNIRIGEGTLLFRDPGIGAPCLAGRTATTGTNPPYANQSKLNRCRTSFQSLSANLPTTRTSRCRSVTRYSRNRKARADLPLSSRDLTIRWARRVRRPGSNQAKDDVGAMALIDGRGQTTAGLVFVIRAPGKAAITMSPGSSLFVLPLVKAGQGRAAGVARSSSVRYRTNPRSCRLRGRGAGLSKRSPDRRRRAARSGMPPPNVPQFR